MFNCRVNNMLKENSVFRDSNTITAVLIMAFLLVLVSITGTNAYSPDSWSYYELAKTFFNGNFYQFNTYRSYFSYETSASFPFGYPALLAVINSIFIWNPVNAAYFNVLLASISVILIQRISIHLKLSSIASLALIIGLTFFPAYMDEIVSGRSIPLAVVLTLTGILILLKSDSSYKLILAGTFFGISVLVRFDFLFHAWLGMTLTLFLFKRNLTGYIYSNIGFFIGISPWIIFSYLYFDKIWISDNSWVTISAKSAYVLDYPAHASTTLFDDPITWLKKLSENGVRVVRQATHGLHDQPLILLLVTYSAIYASRKRKTLYDYKLFIFVSLVALFASLLPYLLTGYVDKRYFAMPFFYTLILLVILSEKILNIKGQRFLYIASIILILFKGTHYFTQSIITVDNSRQKKELIAIYNIKRCQDKEPEKVYIFTHEARSIAFKYGAITGHKTAVLPSNFINLDETTVKDYYNHIKPYKTIAKIEFDSCGNIKEKKHQ